MLSQKHFDLRNIVRSDISNIVLNLRTLSLVLDTFSAVWLRMDNNASSDQTEFDFGWVCLRLAISNYRGSKTAVSLGHSIPYHLFSPYIMYNI